MRLRISTMHRLVLSVMITTVALIGSVFSPNAATAATYYVATNGSDSNSGTQLAPFHTIVKGLSVMGVGDTLFIRGGIYREDIDATTVRVPTGTSWNDAPQIKAYPGETPEIRPPSGWFQLLSYAPANSGLVRYIIFDGLTIDGSEFGGSGGGVVLNATQHIRLQNMEIRNFGSDAAAGIAFTQGNPQGGPTDYNDIINTKIHDIGLNGTSNIQGHVAVGLYIRSSNNLFDKMQVYNISGIGMQVYCSDPACPPYPSNNTVRNSVFHDAGRHANSSTGLALLSGTGNLGYNNILYSNNGPGFQVSSGAINTGVYNNTVYNNVEGGFLIYNSSGAILRNNIAYSNGNAYGDIYDTGSGTIKLNNLTANPLFVNAGANDFHLQSGSPAIDKGTTISIVTSDFDGVARPQGANYDIGACEFGQLISPPIPAPANLRIVAR